MRLKIRRELWILSLLLLLGAESDSGGSDSDSGGSDSNSSDGGISESHEFDNSSSGGSDGSSGSSDSGSSSINGGDVASTLFYFPSDASSNDSSTRGDNRKRKRVTVKKRGELSDDDLRDIPKR